MNKAVVIGTIIIIVLMIGIPTFLNVKNDHEEKLIKVTENRIFDAARKCYLEEKCITNYVTLQDLYDNNYLDKQIDPITKKYYNPDSKIRFETNRIVLELS